VKAAFRSRQVTFELGQVLDPASCVDSQSKVYTQRAAAFDVQQPPAANRHWCICDNKKLSYRRGTARRAVSVETVQTVALMFAGLHLISPATDELPTAQITCKRCINVDLTVVVLLKSRLHFNVEST